jgi:hypothetical protein
MTTFDEVTTLRGLPVVEFEADPGAGPQPEAAEPGRAAWLLRGYDADFPALVETFLARVDGTKVEAIVTGMCDGIVGGGGNPTAGILAAAADRLPALRAVFLGDIPEAEWQISWNYGPQVNPILDAYPALEELWVRGTPGEGDEILKPTRHEALRTLVTQSGEFASGAALAISESDFPQLAHLEIFFGDINYLGDPSPTPDDSLDHIQWLLDGARAPHLRHLGLKNSPIQDEIAAELAHAPVVAHLEVLDLSFGTFSDEGAAALLAGQPLTHLKRLDLTHNFLTEPMRERLVAALPGVEVRAAEAMHTSFGRYVAIGE